MGKTARFDGSYFFEKSLFLNSLKLWAIKT